MQMFYFSCGYTWLIVSLVVPPPTDIMLGKVLFNRSFMVLVQSYISKPDYTHVMGFPATYSLTLQVMQGPAGQSTCSNSGGVLLLSAFPCFWVLASKWPVVITTFINQT